MGCHGQPRIGEISASDRHAMVSPPADGKFPEHPNPMSLFIDPDTRKADVHRDLACTACHLDAGKLPHSAKLEPPVCGTCHSAAAADLLRSRHAEAAIQPGREAPRCWDCHGTHDIRVRSDPHSRAYPLNVIKTCGTCHSKHVGEEYAEKDGRKLVARYMDSAHGRAVSKAGLIVGATCADCHGHHAILAHDNPESSVNRKNVPQTCGRCHVGIEEQFADGVHAAVARNGDGRGKNGLEPPVCNDCHTSHEISRADMPAFLRDISSECGTCHAELYHSYRESYHGQVQRLGSDRAARCSDCHGAHEIRHPADPKSRLSPANIANTCSSQDCHPGLRTMSESAQANFVKYRPHANFRNRKTDPALYYIWLYFMVVIGVTIAFWSLHSLAWFIRGAIERARHGRPHHPHVGAYAIQRFSAWHRCTHGLVIISFLGLTLTGLPLKYNDEPWAAPLMRFLGGPHSAGTLHRIFAVGVLAYLTMHAIHLWKTRRDGGVPFLKRVFGPNSMLPNLKDWRQFMQMTAWFFGRGPRPTFDRWTYWEKFDYLADAFGTAVIGMSGLLLWFPELFSNVLSGYWYNVATVVHGYEALLAAAFIFSIHFFNAHLRWEKFPVDKVIFTGQIPEEEFREERGLQYERVVASGELESLKVKPAGPVLHAVATVAAVAALVLGTSLVVLIVWAGLK